MRLTKSIVLSCALAACGGDDGDTAQARADSAVAAVDSAAGDTVFRADTTRAAPTHRIYYTLTSHAWYAQGRPLVHGGTPHQPSGMPVAAPASEMTRAGEFEGVEYYTRNGEAAGAVYVPVYDGYWQVFRAGAAPAGAR